MMVATIAVGVVLIVGLAVLVGVLDGQARRASWLRIAERRRELADQTRELAERAEWLVGLDLDLHRREQELARDLELGTCRTCGIVLRAASDRVG
jgi:hypothetical protein